MPAGDQETPDQAVQAVPIADARYPAGIRQALGPQAPRTLYVAGDLDVLSLPRVGVLASRQANPACMLAAYGLLDVLADMDICVLGGWHSTVELEMLERLSKGRPMLVDLPAKGLPHYTPHQAILDGLDTGRSLLLTHCGPRSRRVERPAALRRNRLIVALSHALFVPCASEGSATAKLAAEAVSNSVPVATVPHEHHRHLVDAGATPCDASQFREWLEGIAKSVGGIDGQADA